MPYFFTMGFSVILLTGKQNGYTINIVSEETMLGVDNMNKEETFFMNFGKMFSRQHVLNAAIEKGYSQDYHISEVHCIDLIGKIEDANVTRLSQASYMTKGAVSKIIKKLLRHGALESYQKSENKKEVYYRLTELGKDVYLKHEKFHRTMIERDRDVFNKLKEEEKDIVISFFEKFNRHLEDEMKKLGMYSDNYNS